MIRLQIISLLVLLCDFAAHTVLAQSVPRAGQAKSATDVYRYHIGLNDVADDKIQVQLLAPQLDAEEATFCIPKIVPGIYGVENYGRFVSEIEATDERGNALAVSRLDENRWVIADARRLHRLTYQVDDSWEQLEAGPTSVMYRSAGSSFNADRRFVINHNCLFGYFQGLDHLDYRITVSYPHEMTGATSLQRSSSQPGRDIYVAADFRELVDNPVVYGFPDRAEFDIANTRVQIAVFSDDGQLHAAHLTRILRPLMEAQARYLGGQLPVDRYTFIVVWETGRPGGLIGDGLEHSQSTLVLFRGSSLPDATEMIRDICAHEFFHILMPLTIKSEEIANYDFNEPKQSRHLWLYEGMTEYATIHMPVKEGLVGRDEILQSLEQKIIASQQFAGDESLTRLSQTAMERQDQYYNFYLKGALACMCLDIELRDLSQGRTGTQELLARLSVKYGKDRAFRDEELFDVMAGMTSPAIGTWLKKHVGGNDPLPLQSTLERVGITYDPETHEVLWNPSATPHQLQLRERWLGNSSGETEPGHDPSAASGPSPERLYYELRFDEQNPLVVRAELELPPGDEQTRELVLRGLEWGLEQQVSDVQGDGSSLTELGQGRWAVPPGCQTVRWTIQFRDSAGTPVIASSQENVFFRENGWWLVSSPTALLRLQGHGESAALAIRPGTLGQAGATALPDNRWRVPAAGQAPEFFAAGNLQRLESQVDGFHIVHVADSRERVDRLGLPASHAAAFRFLLTLFPQATDLPEVKRRLLVIWLGLESGTHQMGGAAGSRSFVANYVFDPLETSDENAAGNLAVVAHEQFHQLTDLCLSKEFSLPVWANEGLAHYYGLKSLSASGLSAQSVSRVRQRFIDPAVPCPAGLMELSRRFEEGDRSVYPLFYSQGATFWAEVDRAIGAQTDGKQSLDDFLQILLKSRFDESGSLPKSFLVPLRAVLADHLDTLLEKYVGS